MLNTANILLGDFLKHIQKFIRYIFHLPREPVYDFANCFATP